MDSVSEAGTQQALPSWEDKARHRDTTPNPTGPPTISEHVQICGRFLDSKFPPAPLQTILLPEIPVVCGDGQLECPHPPPVPITDLGWTLESQKEAQHRAKSPPSSPLTLVIPATWAHLQVPKELMPPLGAHSPPILPVNPFSGSQLRCHTSR